MDIGAEPLAERAPGRGLRVIRALALRAAEPAVSGGRRVFGSEGPRVCFTEGLGEGVCVCRWLD